MSGRDCRGAGFGSIDVGLAADRDIVPGNSHGDFRTQAAQQRAGPPPSPREDPTLGLAGFTRLTC